MALEWTHLDAQSTKAWSELIDVLSVADGTDETYGPEELAEELSGTGVDPVLDTTAVWDSGQLIAFGQLRMSTGLNEGRTRAFLDGGVHPSRRGEGIGVQLMERLERRGMELSAARHPGVEVKLEAPGLLEGASVRRMLEHRGYRLVRYFTEMKRELPGLPLGEPSLTVQPYVKSLSAPVRMAHNDAFATHWGSTSRAEAEWADMVGSRTFRPDVSFVHLAEDSTVDAYVLAYQLVAGELYIGQVGTIQSARGRGLARACLLACMGAATKQGYTSVDLSVDSVNPTGAEALYESVGFIADKTFAAYAKFVVALS
jgi:mycothiol synthase